MRSLQTRKARGAWASVLAAVAFSWTGLPAPVFAAEPTTEDAALLLEQGRIVEAKAVLVGLRGSTKDAAQRDRIVELIAAADRRLRFMDEVELSLQKAELKLKEGDLRVAETHAKAARTSDKATEGQRLRADAVSAAVLEARQQLGAMAGATLTQAMTDFEAGRYAEAKAGFASLVRSGVTLTQDQSAEVNRYQARLYDLERQQGRSFDVDYVPMGVMASGGASLATASTSVMQGEAAADQGGGGQPAEAQPAAPVAGDTVLDQGLRFDAQRLMLEAEDALKAGRLNDAVTKYTQLTTVYAGGLTAQEQTQAQDKLAEARALLGAAGLDTVDTVVTQRRIMAEEATAVFDNLVSEANAALGRGDVGAARNLAAQARLGWNNAQANGLFSEEQYRARLSQAEGLLKKIDQTAETLTRDEITQRQSDLRTEEARTRAQQERERRERINESLDRLRALQAEQKYEEALQVVEQVLFLDPTNPAALLLKDVLRDVVIYREFEQVRRERGLSYGAELVEIEKSLIVPSEIMSYPADWPELSFRRGEIQSFVESDADRKVLATIETRRIPASFKDNTLEDVLTFVATVTNLNFDVDWDSLSQIGVERDKLISLELREVPARVVLERVLEKAQPDAFSRADWAINDGVLVVAAEEVLRRRTFIVIYDIRDLLFQIPDYENAPELDLDQALSQSGGGGGGSSGSPFSDEDDEENGAPTEEELLEDILEVITTNVDPEGWKDNGGDTGAIKPLNGSLIITNTARNHREVQGLLSQLREIRAVQINVESRFLTVASDFFEQIGFDIDVYFNGDNNQVDAARRQAEAFGLGSLAGEGLGLYPSDIVAGNANRGNVVGGYVFTGLDANGNPQYAFQNQPYSIPAPDGLSVVPAQQNSLGITDSLTTQNASDFVQAVTAGNPALSIAGTFLDDVQVDFLIEATQADRRSVTLSAPRLTLSNGRAANISVVNQFGYVSQLTPIVGAGAVGFDPTISVINSGFSLIVRAVASADRRYVTMAVEAAVSSPPSFTSQTVSAVAAGTSTGGATGTPITIEDSFQIATIDVTQVSTGVTVPDRGTILLGGQRLTREIEIESGVPVLSKLPIINRFFTNRSEIREDQTLLILMKPTIIIQNEEEEKAFPGLLDKLRDPFRGS